jgi:hypothetical protein
MPFNFYDNQNLYTAANKGKSAPSALETDKVGLACSAPSNQVVIYGQNSAQNAQKASTSRVSWGQNILPNPPKSPSQIPILDDTPIAPC